MLCCFSQPKADGDGGGGGKGSGADKVAGQGSETKSATAPAPPRTPAALSTNGDPDQQPQQRWQQLRWSAQDPDARDGVSTPPPAPQLRGHVNLLDGAVSRSEGANIPGAFIEEVHGFVRPGAAVRTVPEEAALLGGGGGPRVERVGGAPASDADALQARVRRRPNRASSQRNLKLKYKVGFEELVFHETIGKGSYKVGGWVGGVGGWLVGEGGGGGDGGGC